MLIIACVNVINLLLGRSGARRREIAIRTALGSSRARLLRQLTAESLVLSMFGAAGGALLGVVAVRYFNWVTPVQLPPGATIAVDLPVVIFAAALGIFTGVLSGIMPAWRTSGGRSGAVLNAGGRTVVAPGRQRLGRALITAQATLSVVLLAGAASLIQSVLRFASAPLGFDAQNVFAQSVVPPAAQFARPDARAELYRRLIDALNGEPALGRVALSSSLPPRGDGALAVLEREGVAPPDPQRSVFDVVQQSVSGGYFDVMRVPLQRGRAFGREDTRDRLAVCIVNDALVQRYFPSGDAIGRRIRFAGPAGGNRPPAPGSGAWLTIVGVVGDENASTCVKNWVGL